MNNKILLIEDNKDISDNIKQYLELEDYYIDQAFDWEQWMDKALIKKYDLILLDLMLPLIDWMTIARKLNKKIKTPIIMLTAKDSIENKLEWFNNWVIDYIVKPFDLRELEVRVKSVLNRSSDNDNIIEFEDVIIDMKKRKFIKFNKQVKITIKEFLILEFLINNKDKVITRTDIIEYVWWENDIFSADGKLDVNISTIRSKLDKKIIKTIKWVWYTWWI